MAIFTGLFAMVGRFAGRVLSSILGWTTVLLFGEVPNQKQQLLLAIVVGALAWVIALIGVVLPSVGTFLVAAVPVPHFVDKAWVRLAMLVAAIVLPLAVGAAAVAVEEAEQRPHGGALLPALLRGYPFSIALDLTVLVLAGVAVVRKARALSRRWETEHIPIVIKPGRYDEVLDQLRAVISRSGRAVSPRPAPRVLSGPPKLLARAAGKRMGSLVPDRMMILDGPDLEVLVYPSDLAMSGTKAAVTEARSAIAAELTHAPAYLAPSPAAKPIEDDLDRIDERLASGVPVEVVRRDLAALDDRLAHLSIDFEEWETLYRERLQLERDLLVRAIEDGNGKAALPRGDERERLQEALRSWGPLAWARAAAVAAMVAAMLAGRLTDRRS